jgi:MFS family permease
MLPYVLFGLLVGALVDRWERRTTMVVADLVRGVLVVLIPFAASISLPLVYAMLFLLACVGNMTFIVPSITLVQRQTPAELRGRVFAVRLMLTYGAFAVSNALAGSLSDMVGVSRLLLVLGGAMLLMAVCASFVPAAREAA